MTTSQLIVDGIFIRAILSITSDTTSQLIVDGIFIRAILSITSDTNTSLTVFPVFRLNKSFELVIKVPANSNILKHALQFIRIFITT